MELKQNGCQKNGMKIAIKIIMKNLLMTILLLQAAYCTDYNLVYFQANQPSFSLFSRHDFANFWFIDLHTSHDFNFSQHQQMAKVSYLGHSFYESNLFLEGGAIYSLVPPTMMDRQFSLENILVEDSLIFQNDTSLINIPTFFLGLRLNNNRTRFFLRNQNYYGLEFRVFKSRYQTGDFFFAEVQPSISLALGYLNHFHSRLRIQKALSQKHNTQTLSWSNSISFPNYIFNNHLELGIIFNQIYHSPMDNSLNQFTDAQSVQLFICLSIFREYGL